MKLTFLGTSAGLPTLDRNVTALALAMDDSREWYLVDCGEGTQHQLLRCRYTLTRLQAIFITHIHGDHMFGLPGLLTTASMQGRTKPLVICAPSGVEDFVRHALACADVKNLPFSLNFIASDQSEFQWSDDTVSVTAHELSHRVPSFAYRFQEQPGPIQLNSDKLLQLQVPRGPLWGLLQKGASVELPDGRRIEPLQVQLLPKPGRVIVIGGDNDQPELLNTALNGADLFVHEATFTENVLSKIGPDYMHSTAKRVAIAAFNAETPHIILTHFSGRYQKDSRAGDNCVEVLRQEAREHYTGTIELAEDLGCWHLNKNKSLIRQQ